MADWVKVTNLSNGNTHWVNLDREVVILKYPDTGVTPGEEGKIYVQSVGLIEEDEDYLFNKDRT